MTMTMTLRRLGYATVAACALISAAGVAAAESPCAALGGSIGSEGTCHVHTDTPRYVVDLAFPVDYPDQEAVAGYLSQDREQFVDWVQHADPRWRDRPYQYTVRPSGYESADTRSLVLEIDDDTGLAHEGHPDTSYATFNYDLRAQAPITIEALIRPDPAALDLLSSRVQTRLDQRGATLADPGLHTYQNFALTDDAVLFFFGESQVSGDRGGPLTVSVPRSELAAALA